jgi:threonine aldolase
MRGFGSDNHSGVHPEIFKSLAEANTQHAPSYGTDSWTDEAIKVFRQHFGPKAEVFFVFNGTAANILSVRAATRPYQAVFCSDVSHLNVDECGAPEFFSGCKLWVLPSTNGKISLRDLKHQLIRRGDQHFAQQSLVSLTQPTEVGTVYSVEEIREIVEWAHQNRLLVHVDGSRLANACVSLNKTFKELTTDLGVDVVSFGGTKNGLMMGEAVIFLNPDLAKDFVYIRKQSAQLPSKTRFISCQFLAYFKNDLWKQIATHSVEKAKYLEEKCRGITGIEITSPVQSNAVFAKIPKAWVNPLKKERFFYVWDENTFECRWMMSWDTETSDIDSFVQKLKELS